MAEEFGEPILFVIDVDPIHEEDFVRTRRAVVQVVRELREEGVQVRATYMAIRGARDETLAVLAGE